MRTLYAAGLIIAVLARPAAGEAQERRRSAIDFSGGYAGFVDEAPVDHLTVGTGWRWQASNRVSVGPELVFMRGPGRDRDLFITGKLVVDFMPGRMASPYFVADGGVMFHRDGFYSVSEGAASAGAGVRLNVTDRLFIAPEFRIGWEPHIRVTATVGWRM